MSWHVGQGLPSVLAPHVEFVATAENTGRAGGGGTALTLETGDGTNFTATAGVTYENIEFRCRVTMASNATFRNCLFSGDQFRSVDTGLLVCPDTATGYLVEYCDFIPRWASQWWHGVKGGAHGTFRRNYFKDVVDGGNWYPTTAGALVTGVIVENFIHELGYFTPCDYQTSDNRTHNDCIQVSGGNGWQILRNTLIANASPDVGNGLDPAASPSPNFTMPSVTGQCIGLTPSGTGGQITNALIEGNRLTYGKYGIACNQGSPAASNVGVIRNNVIDVESVYNYTISGQSPATAKRGIAFLNTMSATFEGNVDPEGVPVQIYVMTVM